MSSASSRSCTASPNGAGPRSRFRAGRDRAPAWSSISGRQRSTSFLAAGGGAMPVRRSRTISAIASSIGASARSVISSNLPRWKRSSSMAVRFLRDAVHAPRADRLDARLLDRLEHRARLLAARLQAAMHRRIVTGEAQRDGSRHGRARSRPRAASACAAAPAAAPCRRPGRGARRRSDTSSSGLRAIARRQPVTARLNGSVGDSFGDGLLGLMFDGHCTALPSAPHARERRRLKTAPRSPSSPAVPRRSSADRTRPRSAAPARRTC